MGSRDGSLGLSDGLTGCAGAVSGPASPPQEQTSRGENLSIIVPAFNEEGGISLVLEGLTRRLPCAEIIVVDDASTDATPDRVLAFEGVRLLRHPFNRGYGASLKTGMRAANGDLIGWFDADNEHKVEDLIQMVEALRSSGSAAVIGERDKLDQPSLRAVGKSAIRLLARTLGGAAIKDINCGLRVFRREAIVRYLPMLPEKFSASMTSTMILMERGYPVRFHRISVNRRVGQSKVALRDGFAALFSVLRIVMLVAPLRILFTSGACAVALGIAYGLLRMLQLGGSFPLSAFVPITIGMFLCVLGLMADQISQFRFGMVDGSEGRFSEPSSENTR